MESEFLSFFLKCLLLKKKMLKTHFQTHPLELNQNPNHAYECHGFFLFRLHLNKESNNCKFKYLHFWGLRKLGLRYIAII